MNLSDALDGSGSQTNSGMWPGQPTSGGGGNGGFWPGSGPAPSAPSAPGGNAGFWPGSGPAPSGPGGNAGFWPGGNQGPAPGPGPSWPGGNQGPTPGPGPSWPGGNQGPTPGPAPSWPGGNQGPTPGQAPSWPGGNPGGQVWPGPSPSQGPAGRPGVVALQNPGVPCKLDVNGGVHNKRIKINGVVNRNADKFIVDLGAGGDLAFHFNPRFNENGKQVIVRNTRTGNKWQKEERQLVRFPFSRGQEFKMEIFCQADKYEVTVDGQRVVDYKHRITNLNSVNKLTIHHDLTLKNVEIV